MKPIQIDFPDVSFPYLGSDVYWRHFERFFNSLLKEYDPEEEGIMIYQRTGFPFYSNDKVALYKNPFLPDSDTMIQ